MATPPLPVPPGPWLDRGCRWLTRWPVVIPCFLVCGALLAWSLGLRLPDQHRFQAVQARALKPIEVIDPPVSHEEILRLRQQALRVSDRLLRTPEEVAARILELEKRAHALDWRVEVTPRAVIPDRGGLEPVSIHPVRLRLRDASHPGNPAYPRLLSWLRGISGDSSRVEITSLRLRSEGAALSGADLDLTLFRRGLDHETNSAK